MKQQIFIISQFQWVKNLGSDLFRVSYEVIVRMSARFDGGCAKKAHLHGCWQGASVPRHMDHFIKLLKFPHDMVDNYSQREQSRKGEKGRWEREADRQTEEKTHVFYELASEGSHHLFCHMILVTQFNPDAVWQGMECDTRRWDHWGAFWGLAATNTKTKYHTKYWRQMRFWF